MLNLVKKDSKDIHQIPSEIPSGEKKSRKNNIIRNLLLIISTMPKSPD